MPKTKLKAKPIARSNRKKPSRFSILAVPRVRALIAIVVFALVGTALLVFTHAQQVSQAHCSQACAGIAAASTGSGQYWEVGIDGGVFSFGGAKYYGSLPEKGIKVTNVIGIAANPAKTGYWVATKTGNVYNFGSAPALPKPNVSSYGASVNNIVAIYATPTGNGYYLVGSDGGVYAFGDAPFHGSMGGKPLAKPMVGMAVRPHGGYWLVSADGGVFSYGGAPYNGGMAGKALNAPIVAMETTASGNGYWLVGADSGIYAFGDAPFYGTVSNVRLNGPITSITRTGSGKGYWLSATDGGVFAFGDAQYSGNALIVPPPKPVAPAPTPAPIKQQITPATPGTVKSTPAPAAAPPKATPAPAPVKATPAPAPAKPTTPPAGTVSTPPRPVVDCNTNPVLRIGSKGDCVKVLQKLLGIAQDGNFGSGTQAAVKKFQSSHGLSADGVVGPGTWAALRGGGVPATPPAALPPAHPPTDPPQLGVKMIPATGAYYSTEARPCDKISNYQQWEGPKNNGLGIDNRSYKCRFVYEQYGTKYPNGTFLDCSIIINIEYSISSVNSWNWTGLRRRKGVGCDYKVNNSASYSSSLFSGTTCDPGKYPHSDWCDKQ